MKYLLISVKETRAFIGTEKEAVDAALAMERELQPAFGVTVEDEGESTVAEIRDGMVEGMLYRGRLCPKSYVEFRRSQELK